MKTYFITTIGCQMNKSDSERLAAYLDSLGYQEAKKRSEADLLILTTCGVRQSAEDRVYGLIPRFKKENPQAKIIFTGCLVNRQDVKNRIGKNVDIWLPITKLSSLAYKLGEKPNDLSGSLDYLKFKAKHQSKISAFVPIGNGCDNFCSYCVVPNARGREVYRSAKDILAEVKTLVKSGYKEITLIAQNVNSYYSFDENTGKKIGFPELLKSTNDIPGDFWIRFATSHPKDMSNELINVIARNNKVCKHIHLPIQAGSNEILQRMNRKYSREDYIKLINTIRQKIKDVSITTDIIVGFPGETDEQFKETARVFRTVKFDQAYIARYSPRPGTAAFKLKDNVSTVEKKKREKVLEVLLKKYSLEFNKKLVGKKLKVLLESRNKKGEFIARTDTNKKVLVKEKKDFQIGKFVDVEVLAVDDFGLEA